MQCKQACTLCTLCMMHHAHYDASCTSNSEIQFRSEPVLQATNCGRNAQEWAWSYLQLIEWKTGCWIFVHASEYQPVCNPPHAGTDAHCSRCFSAGHTASF